MSAYRHAVSCPRHGTVRAFASLRAFVAWRHEHADCVAPAPVMVGGYRPRHMRGLS